MKKRTDRKFQWHMDERNIRQPCDPFKSGHRVPMMIEFFQLAFKSKKSDLTKGEGNSPATGRDQNERRSPTYYCQCTWTIQAFHHNRLKSWRYSHRISAHYVQLWFRCRAAQCAPLVLRILPSMIKRHWHELEYETHTTFTKNDLQTHSFGPL